MRVLVTGGTGFLGRIACEALARAGHGVLALDAFIRQKPNGCETIQVDIADQSALEAAFDRFKPNAAVHLAALLTSDSRSDIAAGTRINCLGTANVFVAANTSGTQTIVYASSVAALGTADPSLGDATRPAPATVYGATKAYCENLATAFATDHPELSLIGLRFGWIYGPGRDRGWRDIQEIIEAVARGERRVKYWDYPDPVDWTWVDDAAEVIVRMIAVKTKGNTILNVAGDKKSMRDCMRHLVTRFPDLAAEPIAAETPLAAWGFRNDRLAKVIAYVPSTTMELGIDKLLKNAASA
jgi:nucleoside-diphosphate-sugar epimerase